MRRLKSAGRLIRAEDGMSLLEVVLAIAILSIILVSLSALSTTSLSSSSVSRDQAVADRLARQGIEIVRTYRDTHGWDGLRKVGYHNSTSDIPTFGTWWNPICSGPDRNYFYLPLGGSQLPVDAAPYVAECGSNIRFETPGTEEYRMLWRFCEEPANQDALTNPSSWNGLFYDLAPVDSRYWRLVILGFPTEDEAFVRSVVCYTENGQWRGVHTDSTLTNWR